MLVGPTKSPSYEYKEAPGKMCRHNLTGYISSIRKTNITFNLVGSLAYLLKYNGCQLALFCDEDNTPPQYSASNISCKKKITTGKNENNQNLQISKSANAQTCDVW